MNSFHCPVCHEYLGYIGSKLHLPEIAKEHFTCCDCKTVFDGIGRQVDVHECPCCL